MKTRSFLLFLLMAVCWTVLPASASRFGDLRIHARFITDRMAYELNLSNRQYDDVFEINYDFFYNVAPYIDRMSYGVPYAVDAYYRYLDERNDDLRWVLSRKKYVRFMRLEHFYQPVYVVNRVCHIRIYNVYPNRSYFYYGRPAHYYSYRGGHCRHSYGGISFYRKNYSRHYNHSVYTGRYQSLRSPSRTRDFPRTSGNVRPSASDSNKRPGRGNSLIDRVDRRPSYRLESVHSSGRRPAVSSRQPERTDRVTRPSISRPNGNSRPTREYRRPESNLIRSAGLRTMEHKSPEASPNRSNIRNHGSSYRRSSRSESLTGRLVQRSSTRNGSSEGRRLAELRSHR